MIDDARLSLTKAFLSFADKKMFPARTYVTKAGDNIIILHKLITKVANPVLNKSRGGQIKHGRRESIRQQILDLMEKRNGILMSREIKSELFHIQKATIDAELHKLVKLHLIDKIGYGKYAPIGYWKYRK